jgi:hypothetical protein
LSERRRTVGPALRAKLAGGNPFAGKIAAASISAMTHKSVADGFAISAVKLMCGDGFGH